MKRAATFRIHGTIIALASLALTGCDKSTRMQSVLQANGADAMVISGMAWLLFGGGALIFVGVMVLLAFSLRDRRRAVRPGIWLIGAGLIFPVTILSALLLYSVLRSRQLTPPLSQNALVISITARMWWWEVRYRDAASGRDITLANEIHLPVGKPVYFALTSDDVIHSFWIPTLAGKADTLPGRITRLRVEAKQPGVFRGQCAEYCGEQHARMALHVVAETPQAFDAWLAGQLKPALPPTNALLARGKQVFVEQRCSACHAMRGVAEESIAGRKLAPDLTHVGSRLYLGAGTLRNHRQALSDWIANTQEIKSGVRMPSFSDIDEEDLFALSSYLDHLK
jgi:cytochrome c oxidase subunit 2